MNIKIIPFDFKSINEAAKLFAKSYSENESDKKWDISTSIEYLQMFSDQNLSFMALIDEEFAGCIFSSIIPYFRNKILCIETFHVVEEFRGKDIGKLLFNKTIEIANLNKVDAIHFLADERVDFPKNWYKDMGFKPTYWNEYSCKLNKIKR